MKGEGVPESEWEPWVYQKPVTFFKALRIPRLNLVLGKITGWHLRGFEPLEGEAHHEEGKGSWAQAAFGSPRPRLPCGPPRRHPPGGRRPTTREHSLMFSVPAAGSPRSPATPTSAGWKQLLERRGARLWKADTRAGVWSTFPQTSKRHFRFIHFRFDISSIFQKPLRDYTLEGQIPEAGCRQLATTTGTGFKLPLSSPLTTPLSAWHGCSHTGLLTDPQTARRGPTPWLYPSRSGPTHLYGWLSYFIWGSAQISSSQTDLSWPP